jgi:hypothetical protein
MTSFRQALAPIIAGIVVGCVTGYGSFQFGQGQTLERIKNVEVHAAALGDADKILAQKDQEIVNVLNRIDREGTQVSRQGQAQLVELKSRFDRLESQQAIAIAQNARNEALLLDLKQRLKQ